MSALRGEADEDQRPSERLLIAISGHSLVRRVSPGMLGSLCLLKHPDKTFIGRIDRGFDFLGYHFGPEGLTLAAKTIEQFAARAIRLYEHEPGEADASVRLGLYVRRWVRWAGAGVPGATSDCITTAEAGGPSQN